MGIQITNEIWEKNVETIQQYKYYKKHWSEIEKKLADIEKNPSTVLHIEKNEWNQDVITAEVQGEQWRLTSKYDQIPQQELWEKQIEEWNYGTVVLVFGMLNNSYLEQAVKKSGEDVKILVYEPSPEIFLHCMKNYPVSEWLAQRVGICVGGLYDDELLEAYIAEWIEYQNLIELRYLVSPNYNRAFKEEYLAYRKQLAKRVRSLLVQRDTTVAFSESITPNLLGNIRYMPENYSISQLYETLPKDIPMILVSAGPSLKKNIQQLKKAKNKAIIMAVDTALKPLLNAGIIPDFFITVDAEKPLELFEHEKVADIPILIPENGNYKILDGHKAKKFFFYNGNVFVAKMLQMCKKSYVWLRTGGSVATSGFSFGVNLGVKTIILVGQDLAHTGGKSHIDGTFKDVMEQMDYDKVNYGEIYVEGIDGTKLRTEPNLKKFLEWFEESIQLFPDVEVIDATEGGALIHGSKVMTLKEAIAEKCQKEYDLEKIIADISPLFTKEEQQKVKKYIQDSDRKLGVLVKRCKEGIQLYKKLEKAFIKGEFNSKDFTALNKKIKKNTNYIEHSEVASLLLPYMIQEDFQLKGRVYQIKDDPIEEGKEIAAQGTKFLETMLKCAEQFEEPIKELSTSV